MGNSTSKQADRTTRHTHKLRRFAFFDIELKQNQLQKIKGSRYEGLMLKLLPCLRALSCSGLVINQ